MRFHWLWVVPLVMPVAAMGCLNDRETVAAEKEFRSRYLSEASPGGGTGGTAVGEPGVPSRRREWNPAGMGLALFGAGVCGLAVVVGRRRLGPRDARGVGVGVEST